MRVVLADDGSPAAAVAAELTRAIAWPPGSTVRVVTAIDAGPMLFPTAWAGAGELMPDLQARLTAVAETRLAEVVERLAGAADEIVPIVARGRPASVVIDEAHRFAADLAIVGSRGHGTIATLVLGSVSSEVADHAPCPVLVARRGSLRRVVFATDGSASARTAEAVLGTWPIFDALPIRVVSVADVDPPWHTGIAPTMHREVLDAFADQLHAAEAEHERLAEKSASRLRGQGRDASAERRTGEAASAIIAVADQQDADLIVLGSRGRTGLARVLLGSVARNVLHGSTASVLVVRDAVES